MVSFLGLRFGSDKKKLRDKQEEAEKAAKKWKKGGKDSFGSDQSFGHTLSKPQRPSSRPGTANSIRSTMLFRAPFANSAATSSMVDLAPPSPRRPSAGSLRQAMSSSNLKGSRQSRPVISGPIGPPTSIPLGGETPQPGTPVRPGTSGSMKKDFALPMDVLGKDITSARPHTSAGPSATKSALEQLSFDIGDSKSNSRKPTKVEDSIGPNGYPSPPPSVKSDDQGLTRVSTEPRLSVSTKTPAPSSLRRVNTADQGRLPSPATSEDGPVVRNVQARRETMTFHSPRRRSFNKNIDDSATKRELRQRTDKEREEIKKKRQTEGFEGNFSAFNFGGPMIDTSTPMPSDTPVSPHTTVSMPLGAHPPIQKRESPPMAGKTAQERGMSESMAAGEGLGEDEKDGGLSAPNTKTSRSASTPGNMPSNGARHGYNTPSLETLTKPSRGRVDSDTRCPDTPTALRAPPPVRSSASSQSAPSVDRLDEAPPPKINPDRRPQSPLRTKAPIEGDFPVKKGLPRGRRPSSPGSQRGRSPTIDTAPPPTINPDRRSQSPLRSRQPIEGNFPKSKGLPRGRQPGPGALPIAPVPVPQGSPPPRPPRENEGVTTIPGWNTRQEKHMSAIPAPLSPMASKTAFGDDVNKSGAPTLGPPRLPSPTFSSLEESMSENFAKAFEDLASATESYTHKPLISPVLSEFGMRLGEGRESPIRVEAKKAPPRPPPISLPPSNGNTPTGSVKSPVSEFSPSFI